LQDHGVVAIEEIDESVFLADASRPAAGEGVAQRLGFTDALKGVTEDFVDEPVALYDDCARYYAALASRVKAASAVGFWVKQSLSDGRRHGRHQGRDARGVPSAHLVEIGDVVVHLVDDNPRPELRPASDEHGTDARLVSRLRDAREVATVVVFHVQIGVQVNENHLSEPPSGS